jgi:hypothetical protein
MEKLLRVLSAPDGHVAISSIDGMGGSARRRWRCMRRIALPRYPDAQIVVDMAGTSTAPLSPAQGLARVTGCCSSRRRSCPRP